MEDYFQILKKYRIIIVVYIVFFIAILYFIWRPQSPEDTSLFNIEDVEEKTMTDRFYSYYKKKLDEIFIEKNYEKIYNDYLLADYKKKNNISLENVEEIIKYRCESFASATVTQYTASKSGTSYVYHVIYTDGNAENSIDIYEITPYNFKISFGQNDYSAGEETGNIEKTVTSDFVKVDKEGLTFELTKSKQYDDFVEYIVKITNTSSDNINVNLIQNSNLVLVDTSNNYYMGSISSNDLVKLEPQNYTTFTVSFNVGLEERSKLKSMKFLKIEKGNVSYEVEITL